MKRAELDKVQFPLDIDEGQFRKWMKWFKKQVGIFQAIFR